LFPFPGPAGGEEPRGFLAGGQVGCDWQLGSIVIGARGLWDWSNQRGHHLAPGYPDFPVEIHIPWVATVVGRIGVLVQPTSMLYVVGGAAGVRGESPVSVVIGGSKLPFESANFNLNGWLVGGGYEGLLPSSWGLGANWSWFVEYNYMDFGKQDVQFTLSPLFVGPQFIPDLVRAQATDHVVLLGLNYRF
jgi:outer membrane immunogenic protein